MINNVSGFSFLALAYNHEKYVIEHLESIKYLVSEYGKDIICNLIINDDCSEDNTVSLINKWLDINAGLFGNVVKLYNKKNIGTCASVLNMLDYIGDDAIKLTACDDVYSYENIFEYSVLPDSISMRTGIPLSLVNGKLFKSKLDVLSVLSSSIIYKDKRLISRFKFLSNNNAPNIIYNKKYLTSPQVKSFISGFDVVEDWPAQVSIAKNFPSAKFDIMKKVFVYYRRTSGSAYIIANDRFLKDKVKVYEYLIGSERSKFSSVVLKNRLYLFKRGSWFANKLLNLSFYYYLYSMFKNIFPIVFQSSVLNLNVEKHVEHYSLMSVRADYFLKIIE